MYFFATDKTVFKETMNATAPLSPRQIDKFAQLLVAVMRPFFQPRALQIEWARIAPRPATPHHVAIV